MGIRIEEIHKTSIPNFEVTTNEEFKASVHTKIDEFKKVKPEVYRDILQAIKDGKTQVALKLLKENNSENNRVGVISITHVDHIPLDIHTPTDVDVPRQT